jgi:hypothetical protein
VEHADSLVEGKGSVRGWLLTVARNIVTDRARARAIRPAELAEVDERSSVDGDHSESVVNTLVVLDALDQVSAEHCEVLVERYYQGRSVTEAAQELGVPPGEIQVVLRLARGPRRDRWTRSDVWTRGGPMSLHDHSQLCCALGAVAWSWGLRSLLPESGGSRSRPCWSTNSGCTWPSTSPTSRPRWCSPAPVVVRRSGGVGGRRSNERLGSRRPACRQASTSTTCDTPVITSREEWCIDPRADAPDGPRLDAGGPDLPARDR